VTDEVALALNGGSLADRMAWVFQSGYQAAVRRCFPEFRCSGWTCFAVAEPRDGPACRITGDDDDYVLDGEKSWIAGAGCLEQLVCSVGEGDGRCFLAVPADAAGVTLSLPREPTFLAEMSQGAASFDQVRVPGSGILREPNRARWFRGAEPLYVLLALNACLKAHAERKGDTGVAERADAAIALGTPLAPELGDRDRMVAGLTVLREATAGVIDVASGLVAAVGGALARSWEADELLFGMFGVGGPRP
jgi:hypothetical protein